MCESPAGSGASRKNRKDTPAVNNLHPDPDEAATIRRLARRYSHPKRKIPGGLQEVRGMFPVLLTPEARSELEAAFARVLRARHGAPVHPLGDDFDAIIKRTPTATNDD